mgnify:CR=1 FL=1
MHEATSPVLLHDAAAVHRFLQLCAQPEYASRLLQNPSPDVFFQSAVAVCFVYAVSAVLSADFFLLSVLHNQQQVLQVQILKLLYRIQVLQDRKLLFCIFRKRPVHFPVLFSWGQCLFLQLRQNHNLGIQ